MKKVLLFKLIVISLLQLSLYGKSVNDIAYNGCKNLFDKKAKDPSVYILMGIYLGQVSAIVIDKGSVNENMSDVLFIQKACSNAFSNNQNIGFYGKFNRELNILLTSKDYIKELYSTNIDDLVINITNSKGKEKLMKFSFTIKSVEPTIAAIIEEYRAEVIDVVINQVSARSSEELLSVGGKALLKEELLEEINIVVNEVTSNNEDVKANNIKKILFTTFVIK